MTDKFTHFPNLPCLPDDVIQEALTIEYTILEHPHIIRSTAHKFKETEFFRKFSLAFDDCNASYMKFFPNSFYDWHIDRGRKCGINWVIKTNPRSSAFFRSHYNSGVLYHNRVAQKAPVLYWKLEEVDYTLYKPTLMNTDFEHCVVNNYPEERIILTLNSKDGTYSDIKEWLQNLKIDQY